MLELESNHAAACHHAQELQEKVAKSQQYKSVSRQQHDVIRAVEVAILRAASHGLSADTLLDSTGYRRLLARHLLLRQRRAEAASRANGQQLQGVGGLGSSPDADHGASAIREAAQRLQMARLKGINLQQKVDTLSIMRPTEAPVAQNNGLDPQVEALLQRKECLQEEIARLESVGC